MNYLEEMKGAGVEVNWLTLLLGLDGPAKHVPLLELGDVEAFATEQLEASPAVGEAAIEVLVATGSGLEDTRAVLRKLAHTQNQSCKFELRKWQFVLLKRVLSTLPSEPLYGLLELTKFWEQLDYPSNSPHIVQGQGNQMSPSDYYSEENYRALIQRHQEWLAAEAAVLCCPMTPPHHHG